MRNSTPHRRATRFLTILLLLLAASPAAAQSTLPEWLSIDRDLRGGYFASQTDERDGSESESDDFRVRIRLGAGLQLNDVLRVKVRAAGRFSTEQDDFSFFVRDHAPTISGLRLGDVTFDEAYLNSGLPTGLLCARVDSSRTSRSPI